MNKLLEVYNLLKEEGVEFFYNDFNIDFGEITDISVMKDEVVIEIDENANYEVSFEEFKMNHSKENLNYHHWPLVREFDNELEKYI